MRDWPVTPSPPDPAPDTVESASDYLSDAAPSVNVSATDPSAMPGMQAGLCWDCDYLLKNLAGPKCPECGREFDPGNPLSMNYGKPIGSLGRLILRPVGLPTIAVILALLTTALWIATSPQLYYMPVQYILAFATLYFVGIVQAIRCVPKWQLLYRVGQRGSPWFDRRWRAIWLVSTVAALLIVFKVPMRVGFLVSQSAFERIAREVVANPTSPIRPSHRAGIYPVTSVEIRADDLSAIMIRTDAGNGGFAYSPLGPDHLGYNPGDAGHLWGHWYWFSED